MPKVKIKVGKIDVNIHYERRGKTGPAVLFVHGIPTNARLWRHVQAYLKDRYQTYAIDMLGYGESDMPIDSIPFTLNNQAEVLKGVITALDLKGKVILVGHDHGGGVSQIFASKYGNYISRLILLNPISFDYWPVLEVEALAALSGASDEVLQSAFVQAASSFPVLMRTGSYNKAAFPDKSIKLNYLGFWGRGPNMLGFRSLIKACSDPTVDETMGIDYSKITCPTMICWGTDDAWMPKEAAFRIKKEIKGPVRLNFIERCGHWSQEDRPEEVAMLIDDFITEWQGMVV